MKKIIIPKIIFLFSFSFGIFLILYPTIKNYYSNKEYEILINNYESEKYNKDNKKLLEEIKKYNNSLTSGNNSKKYSELLNMTDSGMIGYIYIPKINIKLPIYLGTSEDILEKGVGHLENTSIPIGNTNTHSVLSAHRGLPSSKLFMDLNLLKKEDLFFITILNKSLIYKVDKISIVEPEKLQSFSMETEKDYVTLVTCTPYGINTHRLLVRGVKVDENDVDEISIAESLQISSYDLLVYIIIIFTIVIFLLTIIVERKLKRSFIN